MLEISIQIMPSYNSYFFFKGRTMARTGRGHSNNIITSNSKHEIASEEPLFKFATIMAATNNFDVAN